MCEDIVAKLCSTYYCVHFAQEFVILFALLRDTWVRQNGILRKTRYLSTLLNRDIKWIIVAGHYIMKYQVVHCLRVEISYYN